MRFCSLAVFGTPFCGHCTAALAGAAYEHLQPAASDFSDRDDDDLLLLRLLTSVNGSNATSNLSATTPVPTNATGANQSDTATAAPEAPALETLSMKTGIGLTFSAIPSDSTKYAGFKTVVNKAVGETYCAAISGGTTATGTSTAAPMMFSTVQACAAAEGQSAADNFWGGKVQWRSAVANFATTQMTDTTFGLPTTRRLDEKRSLSAGGSEGADYEFLLTKKVPQTGLAIVAGTESMNAMKLLIDAQKTVLEQSVQNAVAAGDFGVNITVSATVATDPPQASSSGLTSGASSVGSGTNSSVLAFLLAGIIAGALAGVGA